MSKVRFHDNLYIELDSYAEYGWGIHGKKMDGKWVSIPWTSIELIEE